VIISASELAFDNAIDSKFEGGMKPREGLFQFRLCPLARGNLAAQFSQGDP
jgi:hypothetical protein